METYKCASRILEKLRPVQKDFLKDIGHSPDQEQKKHAYKPEGLWNRSAVMIMFHLRESGDPIFRATSVLDRGSLKKQGGKLSIHHGDSSTAELLFRIIISVNELGVHGAMSDWCEKLAQQISDPSFSSTGTPVATMYEQLDCLLSPGVVSILTNPLPTNVPVQGNLWGPGGVVGEWGNVCGFIEPPNADSEWHIRGHGAFEINRDVLGVRPTDQSCHHEVWMHLSHVNARLVDQYFTRNALRSEQDRRQGKKRGNPYDHM